MGIREVQERVSERIEKVPGRYVDGTVKASRVAETLSYPSSHIQSSGAVRKSRWPSWAFRPNEPYGFRARKAILNHAHALVSSSP